jgi:hypothetical protein
LLDPEAREEWAPKGGYPTAGIALDTALNNLYTRLKQFPQNPNALLGYPARPQTPEKAAGHH